jgi:uncharacterized protein YkwD
MLAEINKNLRKKRNSTAMWMKLVKYSLSTFLLCISIAVLHSVAYAQTSHQQINSDYQDAQIISLLRLGSGVTPTQAPHLTILSSLSAEINVGFSTGTSESKKGEPTSTPSPIIKPTAAVPASTSVPAASTSGLNADVLFSMVNNHRTSIGLHELQKDEKTCSLATVRASEIAAEMAAGTLHSGMYGRNMPYWNTENAIALGTEEAAFNWWLNEPVHRGAIESKNYTNSCVACSGKYCVQEFTSYQPK